MGALELVQHPKAIAGIDPVTERARRVGDEDQRLADVTDPRDRREPQAEVDIFRGVQGLIESARSIRQFGPDA